MNPFATENRIGRPTYTKLNRYKLKDGDNVYRILPAMGDLAQEGRWSVYYNYVFGFKSTDGKHFPFESPEVYNRKEKRVEVPCAATTLIEGLKAQLETAKKEGKTEVVSQLSKLVGDFPIMGLYTLNGAHFMNVVDRQGNVGVLELGHKAKLKLDNEINRIRKDEGFDPLSVDNGRYFNFRKTGKGRDSDTQVTVVKDKIEVPGVGKVEKDVVHSIDDALGNRLIVRKENRWVYKEAANLNKLYQKPSSAEVELIVKNADITTGKSSGVDALKKSKSAAQEDQESESTRGGGPDEAKQQVGTQTTPPAQNEASAGISQASSVAKETKSAGVVGLETNPKTTAEKVAAMTPEEFMKQMSITGL